MKEELRARIHTLKKDWKHLKWNAKAEGRAMTKDELARGEEIASRLKSAREALSLMEKEDERQQNWAPEPMPELWHPGEKPEQPKPEKGGKRYVEMFPDAKPAIGEWRNAGEFIRAVGLYQTDPRLQRRGFLEGVPSDGGFSVPTEIERQIFDVALESELVRPRARVIPMSSNQKEIPATEIGDHSANTFGGVETYWKAEVASLEDSKPKLRKMTLTAHKLTALAYASSEWLEDSVEAESLISRTFAQALGFEIDYQCLRGDGAGKPLGVQNSSCLISVAKESGQAADTIIADNLFNMLSRLNAASFGNSIWVAHPTTLPQLAQISVAIGTGGDLHPGALTSFGGRYSLLGKPLFFSEKMATLGDEFDILLADFSQYVVGIRRELRFDSSMHTRYTTDEIAFRMITRMDGQPMWDQALTLKDGATEVSPFVTLAERA